ncbi:DUF6323 family protein [Anaerostipes sp.]|uniref:DUF6323 family protein n=1 Tax=Anaerostipes sp. TaxID=1872530 RepID=UPI0025BD90AC|nr:DUF6323 family protein [Anaerostipes sp.]MBS7009901.1 hypothetical protein [Anaerostipes sp.]
MEENFYELLIRKKEPEELRAMEACNEKTYEKFGLSLSEEQAKELIAVRNASLKKYQRVEFGKGILDKLMYMFCDSQYVDQDHYAGILKELQDIFYQFKNEAMDKLTDDELLEFMKEQFETVCMGDLEYLRDTCLERFSRAVRAGYEGYKKSGGRGEYGQFSEEKHWDSELYMNALKELFWD